MISYTVQFFENGETLKNIGLVQIPENFTSNDLTEYIKKSTNTQNKMNFYIKNNIFAENLGHMVSVAEYTLEDIVRIDCFLFKDNLKPDHVINFEGNVTAFKLSEDGKFIFATTSDKYLFSYEVGSCLSLVFKRKISEVIFQILLYKELVFGLSITNKILDLRSDSEIYHGSSIPITFLIASADFIIGLENGSVITKTKSILSLNSRIIFICSDKDEEGEFLLIISESGMLAKHVLQKEKSKVVSLGIEVTACCYFNKKLYAGTTQARIFIIDTNLNFSVLNTLFYYIDWIFVSKNLCAISNFKTLHLQIRENGILQASISHDDQIVFVDGNNQLLLTGFRNCIHVFMVDRI